MNALAQAGWGGKPFALSFLMAPFSVLPGCRSAVTATELPTTYQAGTTKGLELEAEKEIAELHPQSLVVSAFNIFFTFRLRHFVVRKE